MYDYICIYCVYIYIYIYLLEREGDRERERETTCCVMLHGIISAITHS